MHQLFGSTMTTVYGDDPPPLWVHLCGELSEAQIKAGLRRCRDAGHRWPPSLPEFRSWCLEEVEDQSRWGQDASREQPLQLMDRTHDLLPADATSEEVRNAFRKERAMRKNGWTPTTDNPLGEVLGMVRRGEVTA